MPIIPLLLLLLLSTAAAARPSPGETTASLCAGARYPALCIRTLSARSAPSTTPTTLAISSLSASLSRTHSALSTLHRLPSPPSRSPLRDCLQQLSDSADQLSKSKAELDGIKEKDEDVRMKIDDVCTWVSATLTNEDTCLEGMRKVEGGEEVEEVRRKVREVETLTSNALYFVAKLAPPPPPGKT